MNKIDQIIHDLYVNGEIDHDEYIIEMALAKRSEEDIQKSMDEIQKVHEAMTGTGNRITITQTVGSITGGNVSQSITQCTRSGHIVSEIKIDKIPDGSNVTIIGNSITFPKK